MLHIDEPAIKVSDDPTPSAKLTLKGEMSMVACTFIVPFSGQPPEVSKLAAASSVVRKVQIKFADGRRDLIALALKPSPLHLDGKEGFGWGFLLRPDIEPSCAVSLGAALREAPFLNEGIGLQHIQISLGHSKIATTSKYLQRFNPKETIQTSQRRT